MNKGYNINYIRTGEYFFIERRTKNDNEGFSQLKRCFRFSSDELGQEFELIQVSLC